MTAATEQSVKKPVPNDSSSTVYDKVKWQSVEEYLIFLRSKKTYVFAAKYCKNKLVLDFGSGSGYGAAVLADRAREVIGVDINEIYVNYCRKTYKRPNLSFLLIPPNFSVPFKDETFDVVVSIQVIEHVTDVPKYLAELKRVLKDEGVLLLSTPNRRHRLLPFQKPWNPEHIREYSFNGLIKELSRVFKHVEIKGVYGTEEINAIEYERTLQDPVAFYFTGPISKVLKTFLPTSLFQALKRLKNKALPLPSDSEDAISAIGRRVIDKFNVDDLTVGEDTKRCLDFLATCRKY